MKALLSKAQSFFRAVWSFARYGDAPIVVATVREATCYECPHLVVERCGLFCGKCDCPHWPIGDLRSKWRMRNASCPEGKWND